MNIEEERKAFEQLPDIKGILQDGYGFNSELNQYFHPDIENHRLGCAYLMGGWVAYQAQSKKLEGCVVVPVEPTPKMIDSTWDDQDEIETMSHNSRNEFIYKKMIEVAMVEAARSGNE